MAPVMTLLFSTRAIMAVTCHLGWAEEAGNGREKDSGGGGEAARGSGPRSQSD